MSGTHGNRPFAALWRPRPVLAGLLAVGVALLAGCAYRGQIDQPVTLKFTWFSYVAGDDIRAACAPGGQDAYRLIYNGSYLDQVRSYESVGDGAGGGHLTARVMRGSGLDLNRFSFNDPQAVARWTESRTRLTADAMTALRTALADSGAFSSESAGLRMASEQFYWTSATCHDGQFHFNAWLYPSDRFDRLRFPAVLLGHDQTGLALNPPRQVVPLEAGRTRTRGGDPTVRFLLQVGDNGLVTGPAF
ncbi:MAG TPA: hypothetical protein VGA60_10170 [Kiloniellales bacterium]